jgi:hypothetical protein
MCGNKGALNLGNRGKFQLHASVAERPREIAPLAIYIRGCEVANSRPGHFGERLNLWHLPGIEPAFLALPTNG